MSWLQASCAVASRPCEDTFEWRPGRWAAIMLNTCSCVPLQKQTTTIILITALLRPLQQSSRLSSQDTWVSLTHHRDALKNIVAIVWFLHFDLANDSNINMRFSKAIKFTEESIIRAKSWNHHHGGKKTKQRCFSGLSSGLIKSRHGHYGGQSCRRARKHTALTQTRGLCVTAHWVAPTQAEVICFNLMSHCVLTDILAHC